MEKKQSIKDKILNLFQNKLNEELKEKYTSLLEKEHSSFELVKIYHLRCRNLSDERKGLKRNFALANETINELNDELLKAEKKIERLKKQIKKEN